MSPVLNHPSLSNGEGAFKYPSIADWGGTGSTNSLQNVEQSPGSATSPGYVKTEIYHFALDTNHIQSFTTCSMYPQAH